MVSDPLSEEEGASLSSDSHAPAAFAWPGIGATAVGGAAWAWQGTLQEEGEVVRQEEEQQEVERQQEEVEEGL